MDDLSLMIRFFSSVASKWLPEKEWEIISMNYGFFLFRFVCVADRDASLSNGPWEVDNATLGLES